MGHSELLSGGLIVAFFFEAGRLDSVVFFVAASIDRYTDR